MSRAPANGVMIEYDTFGDATDPAVLLIMGLGAQMTAWDPAFCGAIANRGYFVIRFDNRDVGLSTWLDDDDDTRALSDVVSRQVSPAYSLDDMAADAAGLLGAIGASSAQVVGASMGGMIAQSFAIAFPEMTRTLTSIMSTTGDPTVGLPSPAAVAALLAPAPSTREEAIERGLVFSRIISSPGFRFDETRVRRHLVADYDRAFHPAGVLRQGVALLTQPDRTSALGSLRVPTLVIHGAEDPLVNPSGGQATAEAVPGARLNLITGMGHDLPMALEAKFVELLAAHFANS